jgi:hypothetical protein
MKCAYRIARCVQGFIPAGATLGGLQIHGVQRLANEAIRFRLFDEGTDIGEGILFVFRDGDGGR